MPNKIISEMECNDYADNLVIGDFFIAKGFEDLLFLDLGRQRTKAGELICLDIVRQETHTLELEHRICKVDTLITYKGKANDN